MYMYTLYMIMLGIDLKPDLFLNFPTALTLNFNW